MFALNINWHATYVGGRVTLLIYVSAGRLLAVLISIPRSNNSFLLFHSTIISYQSKQLAIFHIVNKTFEDHHGITFIFWVVFWCFFLCVLAQLMKILFYSHFINLGYESFKFWFISVIYFVLLLNSSLVKLMLSYNLL